MDTLALYIHIPFCLKRCGYCDFNSYTQLEYVPSYMDSLKREISFYSSLKRKITSVYIGGGTPTVLGERELSSLIDAIHKGFDLSPDLEFTVEANPETVTAGKLKVLKEGGVNRISFGLQSFKDELLKAIGRIHTAEGFLKKYAMAREAGFDNVNVDLIFGLPGQKVEDFMDTLKKLVGLSPEHISCYSLSVEEGTKFYELQEKGQLLLPSEDEERAMYHSARHFLQENGYSHYEISNFAKAGRESRHNLVYWTYGDYLGLGAGAHSFLDGVRFYNAYGLKDYIDRVKARGEAVENRERISEEEQQAEFMILGLRLVRGVEKTKFFERFKKDLDLVFRQALEKLKDKGLILNEKDRVRLTERGLDLANEVFVEFLP